MDETATPETGPVGDSIDEIVNEIGNDEAPKDAADEVVAELLKDTEEDGQPEGDPEPEEGASEPDDDAESQEDAPQDADDTPEPTFKVKVNGEEIEVSQSELLNGYSRLEDYKAKTAALADERRQVEALKASIEPELKRQHANDRK